jgi:N-acetylglutamate synthase-like GNAT family acetyltransferase
MSDATPPKVECYDAKHLDGIAALIVPIQREEYGIAVTYDEQPDLRDIPGFYQQGAGQFWVALEGEQVVGTIGLRDIGGGAAALRKMFVAKAYRGQRHGTAAALLETLLAHARRLGLKTIYLGTTDKFLAAHRFYEKSDFSLIDADRLPASFPRMSVDSRFYSISLSRSDA